MESSVAKKLWHIFRVVYYMIRKGISKRKLMMDLHILLKRGKIAGKALSNLMTFHHHHHHHHHHHGMSTGHGLSSSSFSCLSMDPNLSFYNPREVEFSCSNTPSYPSFLLNSISNKRKNRNRNSSESYDAHVAAIAKAFEVLNNNSSGSEIVSDGEYSVGPSPMVGFGVMSTPKMVRQLRITDSPFPIMEDEVAAADNGKVDKEAEEFIKWFYEQLRMQQSMAVATPDYKYPRRG